MLKHLAVSIEDQVAVVTLNRPEVHNAFNAAMIAALTETFGRLAGDARLRAVVIEGAGPSFCAGGDIHWMRETKSASEAENLADAQKLAAMFEAVNRLPVPLIGKIHGVALGGGTGLAACCDHVLAVSDASFGLTEVRLGIVPAVISPYVIAKIGHSQARSLFTSSRRFSAEEALRIGLVHEVPENRESLEIRTQIAIKEWLKAGPQAARAAKKLIFDLPALPSPEKVKEHTARLIASIRIGEEAQEGMGALLEKRKPLWFPEE